MLPRYRFMVAISRHLKVMKRFSSSTGDQAKSSAEILDAALSHVNDLGWTSEAIAAGAEDLGMPAVACSSGSDLALHFNRTSNAKLADILKSKCEEAKSANKKIPTKDFIFEALRKRLKMIVPYRESWPEAMAILSKNAPDSLQLSLEMADDIWYYAGDKSVDFSWYTKRLSLMAIYKTTQLKLIQDDSENFDETWEFLNRRVEDAQQIGNGFNSLGATFEISGEICYSGLHWIRNVTGLNSTRK